MNERKTVLAFLKDRYPLTEEGSSKSTFHLTLDLKNEPFSFQPGDSVAIRPHNDPTLVEEILELLKPEQSTIEYRRTQETLSLTSFFLHRANLFKLTSPLLKTLLPSLPKNQESALLMLLESPSLNDFLKRGSLRALLKKFRPHSSSIIDFVNQIPPLLPRFYSIASSQLAHPNLMDLTVAHFVNAEHEDSHFGIASHFLCKLSRPNETPIPLYLQRARYFHLPEDPSMDLIMIGPGTGVAPFRAFMQERLITKASGKQWLFFGERNRSTDFFYKDFWLSLERQGLLKLDLAFSRDQEEKIYVQHRMLAASKELFRWLEGGAYLYLCGDAGRMARDVEKTLLEIVEKEGSMDSERAALYVKKLKQERRFLSDVY